jgi:hypothetical protein
MSAVAKSTLKGLHTARIGVVERFCATLSALDY